MQRSSGVFISKIANETEMSTEEYGHYSLQELVNTLSADRLSPYIIAADGNLNNAVELYRWNIQISGAFYEALSIAEVSLRNSLDNQLTKLHSGEPGFWFDNSRNLLTGDALSDISLARKRANRPGRFETPGRVVSELNFGFWKYILAKRYESTLWTPALRHGFPGLELKQRSIVFSAVSELHSLRNRIAHHEPIHQRDLSQDLLTTYRLIDWISPDTRKWAVSFSTVKRCLAEAPVARKQN